MKKRKDPLSASQRQRQEVQYRDNGKYAKVNPCQGCGKSAGIDYYSHPLTDVGEWNDNAICLCKKCAEATYDFTTVKQFYEYSDKHGGSKV